jgi:deoxyadenosine/deoxycytidine kinase
LNCDRELWKDRERLVVGDYWFNQSPAFARVWLPHDLQAAYMDRWQELKETIAQPRLTVLIDMPSDELLGRIAKRGRSGEEVLDAAKLDQLRCSLQQQTLEPDTGPVMQLASDRQADWESQISAAIIAMT